MPTKKLHKCSWLLQKNSNGTNTVNRRKVGINNGITGAIPVLVVYKTIASAINSIVEHPWLIREPNRIF